VPDVVVGTLYRFYTNVPVARLSNAFGDFTYAPLTTLSRVADGIVHFRVRAYDTNGVWITPNASWTDRARTNKNIIVSALPPGYPELDYTFRSNALPVIVELEIGILEPQTAERFRAIPNAAAQREYLRNQAGRVHLFRQRVDLRNVDLQAYR
jgi:hypothetical protein